MDKYLQREIQYLEKEKSFNLCRNDGFILSVLLISTGIALFCSAITGAGYILDIGKSDSEHDHAYNFAAIFFCGYILYGGVIYTSICSIWAALVARYLKFKLPLKANFILLITPLMLALFVWPFALHSLCYFLSQDLDFPLIYSTIGTIILYLGLQILGLKWLSNISGLKRFVLILPPISAGLYLIQYMITILISIQSSNQ